MKPTHMPTEISVEVELSKKAYQILKTVLSANHRGLLSHPANLMEAHRGQIHTDVWRSRQ